MVNYESFLNHSLIIRIRSHGRIDSMFPSPLGAEEKGVAGNRKF